MQLEFYIYMIEFFKSQKDMKRQRYQEVYMRSNWRKQMMISALALTLSATNVAPVFASAAPDGKTNAVDIAQTMGTTAQWNRLGRKEMGNFKK